MNACPSCGDPRKALPEPTCPDAFHEWTEKERRQLAADARHDGRHAEARTWLHPLEAAAE